MKFSKKREFVGKATMEARTTSEDSLNSVSKAYLEMLFDPTRRAPPQPVPVRQYLPVQNTDLCWRCGRAGHRRQGCRKRPCVFCSRCGLVGTLFRDCGCKELFSAMARSRSRPQSTSRAVQCHFLPKMEHKETQTEETDQEPPLSEEEFEVLPCPPEFM